MRLIDADVLKESFINTDAYGINLLIDKYAIKCIEDAPTIDAEPVRRGRWESGCECMIHAGVRKMYMHCSVCGGKSIEAGRYCPHCGAKMEE